MNQKSKVFDRSHLLRASVSDYRRVRGPRSYNLGGCWGCVLECAACKGAFSKKRSRTRNLFSTLGHSIRTAKRLFVTYLAGPLWVIKQAQWISVEQGHCTLAVVKRYWSVPRML